MIPVFLGSDKTHLTVFAGDKKAWPLYLSISNIKGRIHNAPSNNAWVLIAYLPVAQFKKNQTASEARLFHQCIAHILEPLVGAGTNGVEMTDSLGCTRSCFPLVASHIADYPEQTLVAAAGSNNSPVMTAGFYQLGDPQPSPPHTSKWIKAQIDHALRKADPENVPAYHKAAKRLQLNDVHKPYWLRLPRYQPELCIGPDILHGLICFGWDHILKWIIRLVGKDELSS